MYSINTRQKEDNLMFESLPSLNKTNPEIDIGDLVTDCVKEL